jgi:ketosteroid isomerase-like protein
MTFADRSTPRRAALSVLVLAALSCAGQRAQAPAGGNARSTLLAAEDELGRALASRPPAEAFAPFLTSDAVFAFPGADLAQGKDAALALLSPAPLPATTTTLHRVGGAVSQDGSQGYTYGWSVRTTKAGAAAQGKYLAAWRAGPEGWRVEAFLLRPAKYEPAPPPAGAALDYGGVPSPSDAAAATRGVLAADAAFAALTLAKGYTVSFTQLADARAVAFTNQNFEFGPAGVRDAYGRWSKDESLTWASSAGRAAASGDLGWTAGMGTLTEGSADSGSRAFSNYLTIWARQADGSWRWLVIADNPRPPRP